MTELRLDGGEVRQGGRSAWSRRLRRHALLFGVTILCGAAYLAGIWTGMKTHVTCATTGPGQIVCGSNDVPMPPRPPVAPQDHASA